MFGIRNKTVTFAAKIGSFGMDLMVGFLEEITFNITSVDQVGAAMIPDNIPTVNPFFIQTTSVATGSIITSPSVRKKAFEIISAATFNVI